MKFILLLNAIAILKHCPDPLSIYVAIGGLVCFYRWLFANPVLPWKAMWGPWEALIGYHKVPGCSNWPLWPMVRPEATMAVSAAYWRHSLALCVYWYQEPTHPLHPPTSLPTPTCLPTPLYVANICLERATNWSYLLILKAILEAAFFEIFLPTSAELMQNLSNMLYICAYQISYKWSSGLKLKKGNL